MANAATFGSQGTAAQGALTRFAQKLLTVLEAYGQRRAAIELRRAGYHI